MGISPYQFHVMQDRLGKARELADHASGKDAPLESVLHERIMEYCDAQWPRWKCIHARMDQRSTIAVGAQDFTVFIPGGKVLCIECKRRGQKPTVHQTAWAMEMEKLGHKVHVVTSMDEFMDVLKGATT